MSINSSTITGGVPTLMVHSFHETTNPAWYPAIVRLQTENYDPVQSNLFGYNSIEFWSNHYDSTYQWQVGAITSFSSTMGPFEDSSNYYGGLKLSCSGGPSRIEAENGPVDVMYIIDKKVGIWQSDPKEKLHVGGFIRSDSLRGIGLRQVFANDDGTLVTGEGGGLFCPIPWCLWGNELTTDDGTEYLGSSNSFSVIFKTNGSERMRITADGKIGILTNNPKEIVQIGSEIMFSDGGAKSLRFNSYYDAQVGYTKNVNPIRPSVNFGISDPNDIPLASFWLIDKGNTPEEHIFENYWQNGYMKGIKLTVDGNVGICEVNPTARLTVRGIGHNENDAFKIVNNQNNLLLHVKDNGKVIIGETTITSGDHTDYKLSVDGKIVAKEIIVTLSDWSDYVFNDNYKLIPLNKLEKLINNEKHLPGIPSSDDVLNNGVSIGEMQSKLLKKIEELTLYIIELKKENNKLNKRINHIVNK